MSLDECVSADKRAHYYQHRAEWFPGVCCDAHAPEYVACRLAGKEWTIVRVTTNEHRDFLKLNGRVKVLSGCAPKHIIVSATKINSVLRG